MGFSHSKNKHVRLIGTLKCPQVSKSVKGWFILRFDDFNPVLEDNVLFFSPQTTALHVAAKA